MNSIEEILFNRKIESNINRGYIKYKMNNKKSSRKGAFSEEVNFIAGLLHARSQHLVQQHRLRLQLHLWWLPWFHPKPDWLPQRHYPRPDLTLQQLHPLQHPFQLKLLQQHRKYHDLPVQQHFPGELLKLSVIRFVIAVCQLFVR